jgi:hypothetical protein
MAATFHHELGLDESEKQKSQDARTCHTYYSTFTLLCLYTSSDLCVVIVAWLAICKGHNSTVALTLDNPGLMPCQGYGVYQGIMGIILIYIICSGGVP